MQTAKNVFLLSLWVKESMKWNDKNGIQTILKTESAIFENRKFWSMHNKYFMISFNTVVPNVNL